MVSSRGHLRSQIMWTSNRPPVGVVDLVELALHANRMVVEAEGAVDRERILLDLGLELNLGTLELHLGVGLGLRRNRSLGARRLARAEPLPPRRRRAEHVV